MSETAITNWIKKNRTACIIALVVVLYLGSAMAFRAYRMNPENNYQGHYLPGAPQNPQTYESAEELEEQLDEMFRGPTILERIFIPAEHFFRRIGI